MKRPAVLLGLMVGLPACGLLQDECGRPRPETYYDVQGLSASVTRQPDGRVWEFVAAGAAVRRSELQLRLGLQERFYTALPRPGFWPAAYACSPRPAGSLGTDERMDSLSITSRYDYDARHPAGTPLNDLVEAEASFVPWQFPTRQSPQEPFRERLFTFRSAPAAAGPQQFRIYYRQTNGEIYTAETVTFTLVP